MYAEQSYKVVKEQLNQSGLELTSFIFHYGANVYAFSYVKNGIKKHTLIDAGDLQHRHNILSILADNGVTSQNIERIIITHSHSDHFGLASILAKESGAVITVHPRFKRFFNGQVNNALERWFLNIIESIDLKRRNIEYLPSSISEFTNIGGVNFPNLGCVELGVTGCLTLLGCPETSITHSPDQLVILYSDGKGSKPTNDIIFSGDLWLMNGPVFNAGLRMMVRRIQFAWFRFQARRSGQKIPSVRNIEEQDSEAKEALKRGFTLVRVKPGHGNEFLGASIIPEGLLAERDLLVKLGYSRNTNKSILKNSGLATQIAEIKAQSYINFINQINRWIKIGYSPEEIISMLVRIYHEHYGGSKLTKIDRKQRRAIMISILIKISKDNSQSDEIRELAESTEMLLG